MSLFFTKKEEASVRRGRGGRVESTMSPRALYQFFPATQTQTLLYSYISTYSYINYSAPTGPNQQQHRTRFELGELRIAELAPPTTCSLRDREHRSRRPTSSHLTILPHLLLGPVSLAPEGRRVVLSFLFLPRPQSPPPTFERSLLFTSQPQQALPKMVLLLPFLGLLALQGSRAAPTINSTESSAVFNSSSAVLQSSISSYVASSSEAFLCSRLNRAILKSCPFSPTSQ